MTLLIKMDDSYGPMDGVAPDGTTWASDSPHTAWFDMSEYYITAFKTGSYPAITVRTFFNLAFGVIKG